MNANFQHRSSDAMNRPRSRRIVSRLFALALPLAAAGMAAVWLLDARTPSNAVSYETITATKGTIRRIVSTSGPVRALVTISIGSQLSGQIETVEVDFNSEVQPGDVLARLDARTFEAKAAQAKADLAAAEAALANQTAALQRAEAVLKNAERTIARQKSLASKGFAAQATLDAAIRDEDVAKADIAVARAQIETAKATIAQRKAALEAALVDVDRTVIRSPINGTVISRTVDPGQTVAASLQAPELFQIAQDLSRIRIEAQVNEADVGAVSEGNPVTFSVDAYPDREFQGRVTQVRLAATEINNVVTYTVIIEAKNEDRRLFPGMTANVRIESARRDNVLRVPNDVFRFRPREAAGAEPRSEQPAERAQRMAERLTSEFGLDPKQSEMLKEAVLAVSQEMRSTTASAGMMTPAFDPGAFRLLLVSRIEQSLLSTFNEDQRKQFERWRSGKEGTRIATVWRLNAAGGIERVNIRAGLADDQFTEVTGGDLAEGDKIVVRARESNR